MRVCPSCGRENADDARFCSWCATPLEVESTAREERKVVTCLFCDLVGFTARAEAMDPEDVRRLLQPYHALVRSELERFGGTVEKFIGDAVMAVFGAPVAHEDDPERAVRAALAIRDALAVKGELEIRIGITTGEALIALGARPEVGEGMASGDVVNTAARLQSAAPIGSVLVDDTTYRATDRAVEYGESRSIEAKGKTAPIPVREALRSRSRVGVERVGAATLVGREQELTLLRETLARVKREGRPQLVTLVGVPGIGKSRLVLELFQAIESGDLGMVSWRHGRSLPYGEGVIFWALSEMAKAQAGILESDSSDQAGAKLIQAVEGYVTDPAEARWVERHLRPLAGLEAEETWAGDRRDEAFAAWRRFFEALAEERPLVLVFEDLHWADGALLDFVDYLVERASGVPILALCTARPELLSRRPGWGGGKVNSSTILLSPLSEQETATLVHALLGGSDIDDDVQARLIEHAGGNPLYAEEFSRMLTARPAEVVLPETVQGIIAARLDTLDHEEKQLLQEAAVVGRVFWLGSLGGERWSLEERLHSLERREFVSRSRRSAVAGEVEYAFRHALVREVAYEQIPKSERAEKHRQAAAWIESLGRMEDHAEMLAHHYEAALDFARASGQDAGTFAEPARAALRAAGDRALALNAFPQAVRFYERALELWPETARGGLLLRFGRALALAGDDRCLSALEGAAEGLLEVGDREHAAEAHAFLTDALQIRGRRDRASEHSERALALVRDAPPSPSKARVLVESSRLLVIGNQPRQGLSVAREAFEMADALGLTELMARALTYVGTARHRLGDHHGSIEDHERSIELALSVSSPDAARAQHNLVAPFWAIGELGQAADALEKAIHLGESLGATSPGRISRCVLCWAHFYTSSWDRALDAGEALIAETESASSTLFLDYQPLLVRARIRLARGGSEELVLEDVRRALELGEETKDSTPRVQTLSHGARICAELGRLDDARRMARELMEAVAAAGAATDVLGATEVVWMAEALGVADDLRRRLATAGALEDLWREPYEAVLDRDYERAGDLFAAIGFVDEGYARLAAGEQHLVDGSPADARAQLEKALAFYGPLRATRYIRRAEELLSSLEIPA